MSHKIRGGQIIRRKHINLFQTFLVLETDYTRWTAHIINLQKYIFLKNADLRFIEKNYYVVANLLENAI